LCDIYEPTVEYIDCGCESAAATEDQKETNELPACAVS
jgi:hypothetical protein